LSILCARPAPSPGAPPALHELRDVADVGALAPESRCGRDDLIVLAYSNAGPHLRHLRVIALDESLAASHWHPLAGTTAAAAAAADTPLAPAAIDAPVGTGKPLRTGLAPGLVKVFALFSAAPLDAAAVDAAVAAVRNEGHPLATLTRLPLPPSVLQRVLAYRVDE
jgi:hypothetical protein